MARKSSAEWVAGVLSKRNDVQGVEVLNDQMIRVSRNDHHPFVAALVHQRRVEAEHVRGFVDDEDVEIIVNVPKESVWTGQAIVLAREHNIAVGGMSELQSVVGREEVRSHRPNDLAYVERGLRQHGRVSGFSPVYDRVYRVSRLGLSDLVVAVIPVYELTSDDVRTAWDRYGPFDILLNSNPNSSLTTSSIQASERLNVEVHQWASFYGRLNKA